MTQQEAFNQVWDWFIVQGHPTCVIPGTPQCQYRNEEGNRCALGVLIPDELYSPELEGSSFKKEVWNNPKYPEHYKVWIHTTVTLGLTEPFIVSLQKAHDDSRFNPSTLKQLLIDCAEDWNLDIPQDN